MGTREDGTAALRVVAVVHSVDAPHVLVEVGEELVTEEAALPVAEVDGLDVPGEVGGDHHEAADWAGGEAGVVDPGDVIVESGNIQTAPRADALKTPVLRQDVSLEGRLALELLPTVFTLTEGLAGREEASLVGSLVLSEIGFGRERNITNLAV